MSNHLTHAKRSALMDHIKEHYAADGLLDFDAAVKAREALGFPVSENNVRSVRSALKIPSTFVLLAEQRALQRAADLRERELAARAQPAPAMQWPQLVRVDDHAELHQQIHELSVRLGMLGEQVGGLTARLDAHRAVLTAAVQRFQNWRPKGATL